MVGGDSSLGNPFGCITARAQLRTSAVSDDTSNDLTPTCRFIDLAYTAVFTGIPTNNATENNIENRNYGETRLEHCAYGSLFVIELAVFQPVYVSYVHCPYNDRDNGGRGRLSSIYLPANRKY